MAFVLDGLSLNCSMELPEEQACTYINLKPSTVERAPCLCLGFLLYGTLCRRQYYNLVEYLILKINYSFILRIIITDFYCVYEHWTIYTLFTILLFYNFAYVVYFMFGGGEHNPPLGRSSCSTF